MIKLANYKLILFSLVGIFNTLLDIALYTILRTSGLSLVAANIISVSVALVGSYFLNSRLTFKSKEWTFINFIGFVAVTIFGLWVLQTFAIYLITIILKQTPNIYWHLFGSLQKTAKIVVPKLLATGISFIWNYLWYSKVIFRNSHKSEQIIAALDE